MTQPDPRALIEQARRLVPSTVGGIAGIATALCEALESEVAVREEMEALLRSCPHVYNYDNQATAYAEWHDWSAKTGNYLNARANAQRAAERRRPHE